jgi:hypothetical protein
MISPATAPSPGAAKASVPNKGAGMAFWMAGVPGSAVMVKVKLPSAIAAGISRFGVPLSRNSSAAIGKTAKATTKSETPP